MRTVRPLAAIPAATCALALLVGVSLTGCGSDAGSGEQTTTTSLGASAPTPPTTNDFGMGGPTTTASPAAPSNDSSADEPLDGPVQLDVRVGIDSGAGRIEYIRVGADVTLNITNPSADDEFHIHGIDLEQNAPAGSMATFNFVVDTPGTYEVESHVTGDVVIVLQVV